jgi:hypothetical protein
MQNPKRKDILSLAVVFILSGTMFDLSDIVFNNGYCDTWVDIHLFLKDLMFVGFALLAFIQTPYDRLKLKTFTFMLCLWRSVVLIINALGYYNPYIILSLYILYSLWVIRIYLINPKLVKYTGSEIQKTAVTYNIFIPVNTFRGLLKALFLFWTDPRYETTILVSKQAMYYVKNKMFYYEPKDTELIERFIENKSAMVSIKHITPKKLRKINTLLYKRAYPGIRDCRQLEI